MSMQRPPLCMVPLIYSWLSVVRQFSLFFLFLSCSYLVFILFLFLGGCSPSIFPLFLVFILFLSCSYLVLFLVVVCQFSLFSSFLSCSYLVLILLIFLSLHFHIFTELMDNPLHLCFVNVVLKYLFLFSFIFTSAVFPFISLAFHLHFLFFFYFHSPFPSLSLFFSFLDNFSSFIPLSLHLPSSPFHSSLVTPLPLSLPFPFTFLFSLHLSPSLLLSSSLHLLSRPFKHPRNL